jgi:hypothetical protein
MLYVNFVSIFRDIFVDFASLYLFAYLLIFKRNRNRELFITCAVFNVSLLLVVMTIVRTDFNLAVWFVLFALLSVITVRSTPFTRTEIAYFFAVLALAVINGSGVTDFSFVVACNVLIVACGWLMSLWSVSESENLLEANPQQTLNIVLDSIDPDATHDQSEMAHKLGRQLSIDVTSYKILKIDRVKETMELALTYRKLSEDRFREDQYDLLVDHPEFRPHE